MTKPDEPWTIGRLLSWTVEYLTKHGAENPRLDAEVLLAHARGCRRIDLYAAYGEIAADATRTSFRELVKRRADGTPVAYLVGHREFYSLDFEVTPDVLIPRPETEHLVIALLDSVKARSVENRESGHEDTSTRSDKAEAANQSSGGEKEEVLSSEKSQGQRNTPHPPLTIADIGTGSGILAVCAAKYLPTARVTAVDISTAALAVASRNAERHGVADRIEFVESDLFANVAADKRFDFIISNPPYITTREMADLPKDVREHEPHQALEAGVDGMSVIKPLIEQASDRLKTGGTLLIEISPMLAAAVEQLVDQAPTLTLGTTICDLAGHKRVVHAEK